MGEGVTSLAVSRQLTHSHPKVKLFLQRRSALTVNSYLHLHTQRPVPELLLTTTRRNKLTQVTPGISQQRVGIVTYSLSPSGRGTPTVWIKGSAMAVCATKCPIHNFDKEFPQGVLVVLCLMHRSLPFLAFMFCR